MYKVKKIKHTKAGRIIEQYYVGGDFEKAKKALEELHGKKAEEVLFCEDDKNTTYQHVNNGYYRVIKNK